MSRTVGRSFPEINSIITMQAVWENGNYRIVSDQLGIENNERTNMDLQSTALVQFKTRAKDRSGCEYLFLKRRRSGESNYIHSHWLGVGSLQIYQFTRYGKLMMRLRGYSPSENTAESPNDLVKIRTAWEPQVGDIVKPVGYAREMSDGSCTLFDGDNIYVVLPDEDGDLEDDVYFIGTGHGGSFRHKIHKCALRFVNRPRNQVQQTAQAETQNMPF